MITWILLAYLLGWAISQVPKYYKDDVRKIKEIK